VGGMWRIRGVVCISRVRARARTQVLREIGPTCHPPPNDALRRCPLSVNYRIVVATATVTGGLRNFSLVRAIDID